MNTPSYAFKLTRLRHNKRGASRTVQLAAGSSLHDLHLTIMEAFGWDDDEWLVEAPYVFYTNNIPEDFSAAFVSNNYASEMQLMNTGMAGFFHALSGYDLSLPTVGSSDIQPDDAEHPVGLAEHCKLLDLNLSVGSEFVYDLGLGPDAIVSIKCSESKLLCSAAHTAPATLKRRDKTTSP